MTEGPDQRPGRGRVRSAAQAVAQWVKKQRQKHTLADMAAKVAANTAARVLAASLVMAGAGAGLASLPDTLDGPDARPVTDRLPVSMEAVEALASDAAALRAQLAAITAELEELALQEVEVPDVGPVLADLSTLRDRLGGLSGRVADVEQAVEDAATVIPLPDMAPLRSAVDGVVADVVAARDAADAAALLAGQTADRVGVQGEVLAEATRQLAAVADDMHLMAAELDATVTDVTALADRVAAVEATAARLDGDMAELAGTVDSLADWVGLLDRDLQEVAGEVPVTVAMSAGAPYGQTRSVTQPVTLPGEGVDRSRELVMVADFGASALTEDPNSCEAWVHWKDREVARWAVAEVGQASVSTFVGNGAGGTSDLTITVQADPDRACAVRVAFLFLMR